MRDIIEIEGGEVTASLEDRTITGRLIPFGEEGRTNVGRFTIDDPDAIDITAAEADPSIISLNLDHDRTLVVGRGTRVWKQPDGVYASWTIARTPDGDAALADALAANGQRKRLSGEFGPAVIRAGKLIAGHAKLWGSALVPMGAFPGAMVLAADTPDDAAEPDRADANDEHPAITLPVLPEDITVVTPEGDTALYAPEAAPAEDNPEGGSTVTATETEVLAGATPVAPVPATLAPSAPAAPATTKAREVSARQVYAAMSSLKANPYDEDARQVLAALTDIKISGANTLPVGGGAVRENWVGQVYQGIEYEREYIGLGKLGTDITAAGKKGYKIGRGTAGAPLDIDGIPNGGDWAGNKAEINSFGGFTASVTSTLHRFAVGNDIAREFYDLPGGEDVIEAWIRLLVENHAYWSDSKALAAIVTAAGAPVAPATSSYPANYPDALGMLIQGILAVKAKKSDGRRDVPTFAIANEPAFAELAYAAGGEQNLPAFVDIAVSTNGNGTVDGAVRVVQGDVGIEDTAAVIVGSGRAIEFDELAGGPLHIDAIELLKGGIDRAVHGYLQTFPVRSEAIVLIGTADAA